MIRTMELVFIDLATDDEARLLYIDRFIDTQLKIMERTLETTKGLVDILKLGEDLGTQNGPVISMDLYHKHIKPRHQKFVDLAAHFNIPVMIHTCGSSSWAYEDFIDMGIKIVDTLQPEATNMSPDYLKWKFGGRLCFHGCISTAGVVASGTVEETIKDVRDTLEIMMPGGGYALSPTHHLQDNSPTENVIALYKTAMSSANIAEPNSEEPNRRIKYEKSRCCISCIELPEI